MQRVTPRRLGHCLAAFVVCLTPAWAQSYDELLTQAKSALTAKSYKEAVTATERAISMDDRRWEAYAVAANAYSGQKLYNDAIGMLQMALSRAPQERKQLVRDALQEVRMQTAGALPAAPAGPPPVARPPSPPPSPVPTQAEIVLWKSIENSKSVDDYQSYLNRYPEGTYASLAKTRIESAAVKFRLMASPVGPDEKKATTKGRKGGATPQSGIEGS